MYRLVLTALMSVVVLLLTCVVNADDPYVQHENIVYGDVHGIALVMDVFVPTGTKNGHAIVDVASGAWHSDRSKIRDHKRAQVYDLMCGQGFTVFAVRPGSITKFSGLEMLKHVNRGIRFIKEHSTEYDIAPEELGLMGASAGGHLACLAAVTADDTTRVKATAVFFPPTDFLDYGGKKLDVSSEGRIGGLARVLAYGKRDVDQSPEEITKAFVSISPARLVTKAAPPFLLIHGDADPAVPLQQSQVMLKALQEKDVPAELIVKPGGAHPWPTIHEEVAVMAKWFHKKLVDE